MKLQQIFVLSHKYIQQLMCEWNAETGEHMLVKNIIGTVALPKAINRRFYPKRDDVRQIIYRRRRFTMNGLLAQEDVKKKSTWMDRYPDDLVQARQHLKRRKQLTGISYCLYTSLSDSRRSCCAMVRMWYFLMPRTRQQICHTTSFSLLFLLLDKSILCTKLALIGWLYITLSKYCLVN